MSSAIQARLEELKQVKQDRFLRLKDVLDKTGLSRSVVYRLINAGKFPKQIKIGSSSVFSEVAVVAWMEDRKAGVKL